MPAHANTAISWVDTSSLALVFFDVDASCISNWQTTWYALIRQWLRFGVKRVFTDVIGCCVKAVVDEWTDWHYAGITLALPCLTWQRDKPTVASSSSSSSATESARKDELSAMKSTLAKTLTQRRSSLVWEFMYRHARRHCCHIATGSCQIRLAFRKLSTTSNAWQMSLEHELPQRPRCRVRRNILLLQDDILHETL